MTTRCKDHIGFEISDRGLFLERIFWWKDSGRVLFIGFHVEMSRLLKSLEISWVQFYPTERLLFGTNSLASFAHPQPNAHGIAT